jgi:hypothetical protein
MIQVIIFAVVLFLVISNQNRRINDLNKKEVETNIIIS